MSLYDSFKPSWNSTVQVLDSSFRNCEEYVLKPLVQIRWCGAVINIFSEFDKFSIKFKSGDWGGQTDVFTELQSSQVLVSAYTCTGALS